MNKAEGVSLLKEIGFKTPDIKPYKGEELDPNRLWTIRTVSLKGGDFNLPRSIGKGIDHAKETIENIQQNPNWQVVYNPYFVADYSGMLDINSQRIVLEICDKDSWNLETFNKPGATMICNHKMQYIDSRIYDYSLLERAIKDSQILTKATGRLLTSMKGFLEDGYILNIGFSFGWYDGEIQRYLIFHDFRLT